MPTLEVEARAEGVGGRESNVLVAAVAMEGDGSPQKLNAPSRVRIPRTSAKGYRGIGTQTYGSLQKNLLLL